MYCSLVWSQWGRLDCSIDLHWVLRAITWSLTTTAGSSGATQFCSECLTYQQAGLNVFLGQRQRSKKEKVENLSSFSVSASIFSNIPLTKTNSIAEPRIKLWAESSTSNGKSTGQDWDQKKKEYCINPSHVIILGTILICSTPDWQSLSSSATMISFHSPFTTNHHGPTLSCHCSNSLSKHQEHNLQTRHFICLSFITSWVLFQPLCDCPFLQVYCVSMDLFPSLTPWDSVIISWTSFLLPLVYHHTPLEKTLNTNEIN